MNKEVEKYAFQTWTIPGYPDAYESDAYESLDGVWALADDAQRALEELKELYRGVFSQMNIDAETIEAQAKEIEIKDKEIDKLGFQVCDLEQEIKEKDKEIEQLTKELEETQVEESRLELQAVDNRKEIERLKEGIAEAVKQLDISSDEQSWNGAEWAINDLRELL